MNHAHRHRGSSRQQCCSHLGIQCHDILGKMDVISLEFSVILLKWAFAEEHKANRDLV